MNLGMRLALGLAVGAVAAGLGAWLLASLQRWRRKNPEQIERQRRLDVNRRGRIALGRVVDVMELDGTSTPSRLIAYTYQVAGVSYEAAQDVSALPQVAVAGQGLAGQTVSVKYDPKRPASSILACEEWCGIALNLRPQNSEHETGEKPELVPPPARSA